MRPGSLASVCGMREVKSSELAARFGCPIGTTLYLVEFGDGFSLEIPAALLEVAEADGA